MISVWNIQYGVSFFIFSFTWVLFYLNYSFLESPVVCNSEPYEDWIKYFLFLISGASIGQVTTQFFRLFMPTFGMGGKLRHPKAFKLILAILCFQFSTTFSFYLGWMTDRTCVDVFDVKSPPFLWIEWLCTVPTMFFLVLLMDLDRKSLGFKDIMIQFFSGMSIFLLFSINFSLNLYINYLFFIISNNFMFIALLWLFHDASTEYMAAHERINNPTKFSDAIDSSEFLKVSRSKYNCALFMLVSFCIFPFLYYLKFFRLLSDEMYILMIYVANFLVKSSFTQVVSDFHIEILDTHKFLYYEERKKHEEYRLMFLRYVFHEVRVPLNSISLGVQMLLESKSLDNLAKETLEIIDDSTRFMSETLNDVLSLQKIEQGMLKLEYKPFSLLNLIKKCIGRFL